MPGDASLVERFFAEARAVNLIRHEGIVNVLDLVAAARRSPGHRDGADRRQDARPARRRRCRAARRRRAGRDRGARTRSRPRTRSASSTAISSPRTSSSPRRVARSSRLRHRQARAEPRARAHPHRRAARHAALHGARADRATATSTRAPTSMRPAWCCSRRVTGQRPFDETSEFALMRAHLERSPPSPRALRPELPIALERDHPARAREAPRRSLRDRDRDGERPAGGRGDAS